MYWDYKECINFHVYCEKTNASTAAAEANAITKYTNGSMYECSNLSGSANNETNFDIQS
jgi:hypothetical protein